MAGREEIRFPQGLTPIDGEARDVGAEAPTHKAGLGRRTKRPQERARKAGYRTNPQGGRQDRGIRLATREADALKGVVTVTTYKGHYIQMTKTANREVGVPRWRKKRAGESHIRQGLKPSDDQALNVGAEAATHRAGRWADSQSVHRTVPQSRPKTERQSRMRPD